MTIAGKSASSSGGTTYTRNGQATLTRFSNPDFSNRARDIWEQTSFEDKNGMSTLDFEDAIVGYQQSQNISIRDVLTGIDHYREDMGNEDDEWYQDIYSSFWTNTRYYQDIGKNLDRNIMDALRKNGVI